MENTKKGTADGRENLSTEARKQMGMALINLNGQNPGESHIDPKERGSAHRHSKIKTSHSRYDRVCPLSLCDSDVLTSSACLEHHLKRAQGVASEAPRIHIR